MLFNSIPYLIFFPIVLALFWVFPKRLRRPLLLLASYVFYMSWIPSYGLLIAALTGINYIIALAIAQWRGSAKLFFVSGVVLNLGALCFFKYANFLLLNWFAAAGWISAATHQSMAITPFTLNIILPLGISFFAFEFIHYITDVYKGGAPIRNIIDFSLFAAFFPSQLAGPIKRYQDFVQQLGKESKFNGEQFNRGCALLLQGLFKKVALADNLSIVANTGFGAHTGLGMADAWLTVLAFTLQIYFDFSGYTDMGRGSGLLLGFELPDNFNFPYLARSLQDFWKRWHISLSTWLRDYLYIPLGGNRGGTFAKYKNLVLTMLLGGLWHGAAWHFVIWGGIHGFGLVINHWYDEFAKRSGVLTRFHATAFGLLLSGVVTFFFVVLGWIFFRADTVADAVHLLQAMFNFNASSVLAETLKKSTVGVSLAIYATYATVFCLPNFASGKPGLAWLSSIREAVMNAGLPARIVVYCGIALAVVGFAPAQPSAFIYFQF